MKKKELRLAEKEGWIFIGEIEFKYSPFSKYRDDEPVFMYMKAAVNEKEQKVDYWYGFSRGIACPTYLSYFTLDKRYSINTVLQFYISHDIILQRDPNGNRPILPSEKQAYRFAGSKEWVYPNDDFLNKRIELDDLEKLWRSDKEQKWIDEYMHNQYASEEDKNNVKTNGRYIV